MTVPTPRPERPGAVADGDRGRRVVVGVDGSEGSRAALEYALRAAARRDARLEVVSAFPVQLFWTGVYPVSAPSLDAIQRDTDARMRAFVEEARTAAPVHVPDDRVTVTTTAGAVAQSLLDRAEDADLLVVGSRGRGGMRSAVLGSVSLHCVTGAGCPVVVVHPPEAVEPVGRPGRVVVGVDGSLPSSSALLVAAEEATRSGAVLEVVAVYRLADYWSEMYDVLIPSEEQIRTDVRRRTEAMVEWVRSATEQPPEMRVVVVEGFAGDELLGRARGAELLVVGSGGRGAVRGLLLGSVALHCVLHAPCPIEVVHPDDAQRADAAAALSRQAVPSA